MGRSNVKRPMWIVIACLLLGSASAFANDGPAQGRTGVAWQDLSPEQQQALEPLRERWQHMTPAQRARAGMSGNPGNDFPVRRAS